MIIAGLLAMIIVKSCMTNLNIRDAPLLILKSWLIDPKVIDRPSTTISHRFYQ